MVVGDFHIVSILTFPTENDAPLVVDPDGIKSFQNSTQKLKTVPGWIPQIVEGFGFMDGNKFVI